MSPNSDEDNLSPRQSPEQIAAAAAVFAAPWEAEAFALALTLSLQGLYSWREWSEVLGEELARSDGNPSSYYLRWLAALERLAVAKGIVDERVLDTRKQQWIEAFLSTPHGQPVELRSR